jgi:hypothetical protein
VIERDRDKLQAARAMFTIELCRNEMQAMQQAKEDTE